MLSLQTSSAAPPKTSALSPIIYLLLEETGPVSLRVGQTSNQRYTSDQYPDGLELRFDRLFQDVDLSITMDDIPDGASVEIYINGQLAGTLTNGINQFTIPASELSHNTIVIRLEDGTEGSWTVTRISSELSTGPKTRADAQLFLARATFGPTRAELDRVLEIGYEAWIDEQLRLPRVSSIDAFTNYQNRLKDDVAIDVNNNGPTTNCVTRGFLETEECITYMHALLDGSAASRIRMDQWWERTIRSNDQLRQRVVYALSQVFVVSTQLGNALRGRQRAAVVYEDVLSKHAFGSYRDLLKDITLNPAMAYYLSFVGNQKAGRFGQPDENYAREIMQLFSIGLTELNQDGTPRLDANGREIETYSPETVQNLARIFTGWIYSPGSFVFSQWDLNPLIIWGNGFAHDFDEKTFMGRVHPAGLSQEEDLDMALDSIANHPNVAPFISTRLIERLVMSNPPREYVGRVAAVFRDNGSGEYGDLGAVVKAILLDPAALGSPSSSTGGKILEPVIAISKLWRAFNAQSDIGRIRYGNSHSDFGQRPYDAPSVFNFYAPTDGPASLKDQGLVAPEMKLFRDEIVLKFLGRMLQMATSELVGSDPVSATAPYSSDRRRAMILNLSEAEALADNLNDLMDFYQERLFGGIMSQALRNDVITFLETLPDQGSVIANRQYIAQQALTVITVSPEYNFQR